MVEDLISKLDSMTDKRRVVLLFSTEDESTVQEQILPKLPEQNGILISAALSWSSHVNLMMISWSSAI